MMIIKNSPIKSQEMVQPEKRYLQQLPETTKVVARKARRKVKRRNDPNLINIF